MLSCREKKTHLLTVFLLVAVTFILFFVCFVLFLLFLFLIDLQTTHNFCVCVKIKQKGQWELV